MISLKVSLSVHQVTELRAKIKLESDDSENTLPFDNLIVETSPAQTESTELRLQLTKNSATENKLPSPDEHPVPTIKWWRRLINAGHVADPNLHKNQD